MNDEHALGVRCCMLVLLALTGLAAAGGVLAGELRVEAPVVDFEPLTGPAREIERCEGKPADGASIARVLAWDLGLNCRTERIESTVVTGYRVFYRWDDRVYSQVLPSAPGATIPLKVRLD